MKILVSNDDGYLAKGINCLALHLKESHEIVVVAPDRNKSGASNSLTLTNPLRVFKSENNGFLYVEGTPTDCVHLALTGLIEMQPDIVVSGINHGSNLGDDTLYSGTVAAAMEGRFLGLPSIAISLSGRAQAHYDSAAKVALKLLSQFSHHGLPKSIVLNVNVPDLPYEEIKGFKITRLGSRHKAEAIIKSKAPNSDDELYWVGPVGKGQDVGEGTDFDAVENGYVSITPLVVDLTAHQHLGVLNSWLDNIS